MTIFFVSGKIPVLSLVKALKQHSLESERYCMCAMRSRQIQFSGMNLRDCDMFLIMILFCLAVQTITGMCVDFIKTHRSDVSFPSLKCSNSCFPQRNGDYDKFTAVALLFTEWFMLENTIYSIRGNQLSVTWKIEACNSCSKNALMPLQADRASFKMIAIYFLSVWGMYWQPPTQHFCRSISVAVRCGCPLNGWLQRLNQQNKQ